MWHHDNQDLYIYIYVIYIICRDVCTMQDDNEWQINIYFGISYEYEKLLFNQWFYNEISNYSEIVLS